MNNNDSIKNIVLCVEIKKKKKQKECEENGCTTQPSFNISGSKSGLYCFQHKSEGMVDVVTKKCGFDDECSTKPYFNIIGSKSGLYCYKHKTEGMVDVLTKKCEFNGCTIQPIFNIPGSKRGKYCVKHKTAGMVDVINNICKTDLCDILIKKKYSGYCLFCYMNLFPDKPVSRNYKTKERSVVEFVQNNFPNVSWIFDKSISDGCSSKRPDIFLDLGYQILLVEIDENQHQAYENICENKRTMTLSLDLQHRPMIFIRFNPDKYIDKNNKKITSCWSPNKNGINVVSKNKQTDWIARLSVLKTRIEYWLNPDNLTDKTIEIEHLFYDE